MIVQVRYSPGAQCDENRQYSSGYCRGGGGSGYQCSGFGKRSLSRHAFFFFPAGEEIRPNSPKTGLLASPANKAYLRNITESIYLYIRFDFSSLSFFGGFLAA